MNLFGNLKCQKFCHSHISYIVCLLLSLCSTTFLYKLFDINASLYAYSNSILSLLVFVGLFLLYQFAWKSADRRSLIISLILGFIFTLFLYVGNNILKYDSFMLYSWKDIIIILSETPLFAAIVLLILVRFTSYSTCLQSSISTSSFRAGRTFLIVWAVIFLAWLPGFIASYPGVYGYDSIFQVGFYSRGEIILHHPLIHTYFLGFCVLTVGKWLGSFEIGMAVYSIVQMLLLSAAFSFIYLYLRKINLSRIYTTVILLFFALLPTNAIMSFSSTKDVLYAALFALMILCFCEIVRDKTVLKSLSFDIAFVSVCFAQMIFRNQGKYVFLLSAIVLIFAFREDWKRMLVLCLSVCILFTVYSGPVTKLCNGVDSNTGIREMMSVPCMQLSHALLKNESQLTAEEKSLIEIYIPKYRDNNIFRGISDNMKNTFNSDRFRENPAEFVKLWLSVGVKSPKAYLYSWARLTIGLWYPDMNYRDTGAWHPYWEYQSTGTEFREAGYTVVERQTPEFMQWLADFYNDITYNNSYQKLPLVSLLFSSGLPFWLLLIYIAVCIYKRYYKMLIPAFPMLLLWLTLMLGPVVLYRYVYPLIVALPILFGTLISYSKKNNY